MGNPTSMPEQGPYQNIDPQEAWEILHNDKAILVDVRTMAEWSFVGVPDLSSLGKETLFISWQIYPHMQLNETFIGQLKEQVADVNIPLVFICRVGGRSGQAAEAASQAGFTHCYNIMGGFEGDLNTHGQRGVSNGWKVANLPWKQS